MVVRVLRLRLTRRRALSLASLAACVGALVYTAVALGGSSVGVPLTQAQINSVKTHTEAAIALEETALRKLREHERAGAAIVISDSMADLSAVGAVLHSNTELKNSEEDSLTFGAHSEDANARTAAREGKWSLAQKQIDAALAKKRAAMIGFDQWQPQDAAPTPTPPPTTSGLQYCFFTSAASQLKVKVSWQGEGGAKVIVTVGPSTDQMTTTLGPTGIGYAGPFTVQGGATYPILIQASNPTTGKSAAATTSGFEGSAIATDCQVESG